MSWVWSIFSLQKNGCSPLEFRVCLILLCAAVGKLSQSYGLNPQEKNQRSAKKLPSQNCRVVEVGQDLWRSPSSALLLKSLLYLFPPNITKHLEMPHWCRWFTLQGLTAHRGTAGHSDIIVLWVTINNVQQMRLLLYHV